ncbi:carbamoyltransferase HypF [Marinobacterium stanieri]|uniref:Carbamoyltransferase HypF n=1 Tax=Marinobacterium stanieri TaxID=49186 RepID=A0A1N6QZX1_9GAMM|nr:carbamoyltransferase HypF [Marinobacterium stanieri]SIQ21886.1 Hydrogenase maturation protein, carbamoyltransferase HypF [Marinobacterium stanieri]
MPKDADSSVQLFRLCYQGCVQGVGFRPVVWHVARSCGLAGQVKNTAGGVEVLLWADEQQCQIFTQQVSALLPPQADIHRLDIEPVNDALTLEQISRQAFSIQPSSSGFQHTRMPADTATCPDCLQELFDPDNRRYRYPFINCTYCGPRYTVIRKLPYDRASTTLVGFPMCSACDEEYQNPEHRRFHAQTNVCPECGPRLWLENPQAESITPEDTFTFLAQRLRQGEIVALKGLGGFHLCCDARNETAVKCLRQRKGRPAKALALMLADTEAAKAHVELSSTEADYLSSPQAPILLCRKRSLHTIEAALSQQQLLAESIAPDSHELGIMLPYTPIHHLLMQAFGGPLVMTSGNPSGQLQVINNEDARKALAPLAGWLLLHDRPIERRIDDAVVRVVAGKALQVLRPGRGFAPLYLPLPAGFNPEVPVLALGGDLKNTLCLSDEQGLHMTPFIGDLAAPDAYQAHRQARIELQQECRADIASLACDAHPNYISTRQARSENSPPLAFVQHHHAHMASCLVDNAYPLNGPSVLALCLDGTGYGEDGSLWGGECLLGDYANYRRVGQVKPFPLPGGKQAILQPWRILASQLHQAGMDWSAARTVWSCLGDKPLDTITAMIDKGVNTPITSSMGRLFDAMAAALGCYAEGISYEGQAAIKLEQLAQSSDCQDVEPYTLQCQQNAQGLLQLEAAPLWYQLVDDLRASRPRCEIAVAFHLGVIRCLLDMVYRLGQMHPFQHVVLTGGVMQNRFLSERLEQGIAQLGYTPLCHQRVPCNDAGLSVGQAAVALARVQGQQQGEGEPNA